MRIKKKMTITFFLSACSFVAMNSAETRFAHLLQPIRDLTKNWDVDLATQLGEYLEEVTVCFTSQDQSIIVLTVDHNRENSVSVLIP